ncbi:MAG: hypothetical protein AAGU27_18320 [Dehalobacterium sp.]
MNRLILLLTIILIVFSLLTYLLHRFFTPKKYVKYMLPLFLLLGAAYQFYLSRQPSQGFEDLAQFILALMCFTGALAGIITGIILDRFYPKN